VGIAYGTVGVAALTGRAAGRLGDLARRAGPLLWPLVPACTCPTWPTSRWRCGSRSLWMVSAAIAIEQFGYGFGFTAYMVYMLMVAEAAPTTTRTRPRTTRCAPASWRWA
jgi:MFS transporter, PAT family, beta-lactamase induction signal transducer AmpG